MPRAQDNSEYFFNLAPSGLDLLAGWLNGPAVVMRVHTHDPEAASCSADKQAACEAAVVVEAVVWPTVPAQIDGERVYRAADQASFPISGSFLLGGPFTKPQFVPPCPMQPNLTAAEQQLIPYCYILSIDGLSVAPESNIDEPNGEIVVARVHIDDPRAAQCPAGDRAQCQAAIVVEAVVWRGETPATSASPTPDEASSPNSVSAESAGPVASTGSGDIGPDGVPIDAQRCDRLQGLESAFLADLPARRQADPRYHMRSPGHAGGPGACLRLLDDRRRRGGDDDRPTGLAPRPASRGPGRGRPRPGRLPGRIVHQDYDRRHGDRLAGGGGRHAARAAEPAHPVGDPKPPSRPMPDDWGIADAASHRREEPCT